MADQSAAVTREDALAFADEAFRNRDITFSHRDVVDMTAALGSFLSRHRLASVSSASAETADHVPDAGKMVPEPVPETNQGGEVERGTAFAKLNNWLDEHGYAGSLADLRAVRGDEL